MDIPINKQLFSRPKNIASDEASTSIQDELIKLIASSKSSLKIAVAWFTNQEIYEAILMKLENPNYHVELIVLNDRINNKVAGNDFQKMIGPNADFYFSEIDSMLHHKFCIVDENLVVTGSYNWTYYAENRNWENVIISSDSQVVACYLKEFSEIIKLHQNNKVINVASQEKKSASINSDDYLYEDYLLQANKERKRSNDSSALLIYSETLTLKKNTHKILEMRNELLLSTNKKMLKVSPFEIGVEFANGPLKMISLGEKLECPHKTIGASTDSTAYSYNLAFYKKDRNNVWGRGKFPMQHISPMPIGANILEISLFFGTDGILLLECIEINGQRKIFSKSITIEEVEKWK